MTTIQQQMKQLHQAVFDDEYYCDIYCNNLFKHEMVNSGIIAERYSDAKIVDFANDFWLDLPDSPAIRTGPFWLLCDICESMFDEDE